MVGCVTREEAALNQLGISISFYIFFQNSFYRFCFKVGGRLAGKVDLGSGWRVKLGDLVAEVATACKKREWPTGSRPSVAVAVGCVTRWARWASRWASRSSTVDERGGVVVGQDGPPPPSVGVVHVVDVGPEYRKKAQVTQKTSYRK